MVIKQGNCVKLFIGAPRSEGIVLTPQPGEVSAAGGSSHEAPGGPLMLQRGRRLSPVVWEKASGTAEPRAFEGASGLLPKTVLLSDDKSSPTLHCSGPSFVLGARQELGNEPMGLEAFGVSPLPPPWGGQVPTGPRAGEAGWCWWRCHRVQERAGAGGSQMLEQGLAGGLCSEGRREWGCLWDLNS